jgi:hypothetical protein
LRIEQHPFRVHLHQHELQLVLMKIEDHDRGCEGHRGGQPGNDWGRMSAQIMEASGVNSCAPRVKFPAFCRSRRKRNGAQEWPLFAKADGLLRRPKHGSAPCFPEQFPAAF